MVDVNRGVKGVELSKNCLRHIRGDLYQQPAGVSPPPEGQ